EDRPAGEGEGVHRLRVTQQMELEVVSGAGRDAVRGDPVADLRDEGLERRVLVEAPELFGHRRGGLQADRDLLVLREADVLRLAGDGIELADAVIAQQGESGHEQGHDDSGPSHQRLLSDSGGRSPGTGEWEFRFATGRSDARASRS